MRRLGRSPIMVEGRKVFGFSWNGCSASTVTVFGFQRYSVRLRPEYAPSPAHTHPEPRRTSPRRGSTFAPKQPRNSPETDIRSITGDSECHIGAKVA